MRITSCPARPHGYTRLLPVVPTPSRTLGDCPGRVRCDGRVAVGGYRTLASTSSRGVLNLWKAFGPTKFYLSLNWEVSCLYSGNSHTIRSSSTGPSPSIPNGSTYTQCLGLTYIEIWYESHGDPWSRSTVRTEVVPRRFWPYRSYRRREPKDKNVDGVFLDHGGLCTCI